MVICLSTTPLFNSTERPDCQYFYFPKLKIYNELFKIANGTLRTGQKNKQNGK